MKSEIGKANKKPFVLKKQIPNRDKISVVAILVNNKIATFFILLFLNKYIGIIIFKLYKLLLINRILDAYIP